jgi:hypothetical protein
MYPPPLREVLLLPLPQGRSIRLGVVADTVYSGSAHTQPNPSRCISWSKSNRSSIGVDAFPWGATPSVPAKCAELFTYRLGDE